MGLGGSGIGEHGALENKGLRKEVKDDNHIICGRETNIRIFYRRRVGGGFRYLSKAVVSIMWSQTHR